MKIATFNLYQFLTPGNFWYRRNKKNRYKKEQWYKKKHWILDQLELMNADVVGFQEVFSPQALQALTANAGYEYCITVEQPAVSPIDDKVFVRPVCALASRFPVQMLDDIEQSYVTHPNQADETPFRFRRQPVKVMIDTPQWGNVIVYIAHLKSRRPIMDDVVYPKKMPWKERAADTLKRRSEGQIAALIQRGAEATHLYQAMHDDLQKYPKTPVILMGDLNDDLNVNTHQALTMTDHLNYIGGIEKDDWPEWLMAELYDYRFFDSFRLANNTPTQAKPHTHLSRGKLHYFDHILVSNHLNPRNPDARGCIAQYQAYNQHLSDNDATHQLRSDHAPVCVTLAAKDECRKARNKHKQKTPVITRQMFIDEAGGVYQSRYTYSHLSSADKWDAFWSFFFDTDHGWVRSVYGSISVEKLFAHQRHSIEHVIPESFLQAYLRNKRVPKQIRYGAATNPFNWVASDKKINSSRSNFPFEFDPEGHIVRPRRMKIDTHAYVTVGLSEEERWVIPSRSRGDIARAILYMVLTYEIDELYNEHLETLVHWIKVDPPASWELAYNEWVFNRLGIRNPLIDEPEAVRRFLENQPFLSSCSVKRHSFDR